MWDRAGLENLLICREARCSLNPISNINSPQNLSLQSLCLKNITHCSILKCRKEKVEKRYTSSVLQRYNLILNVSGSEKVPDWNDTAGWHATAPLNFFYAWVRVIFSKSMVMSKPTAKTKTNCQNTKNYQIQNKAT